MHERAGDSLSLFVSSPEPNPQRRCSVIEARWKCADPNLRNFQSPRGLVAQKRKKPSSCALSRGVTAVLVRNIASESKKNQRTFSNLRKFLVSVFVSGFPLVFHLDL